MLSSRKFRLAYLRTLWKQRVWTRWVLGIWALAAAAFALRDEFVPAEWQQRMKVPVVVGFLSWQAWTIILLLIVIAGLFEASFRAHRAERQDKETAEKLLLEKSGIKLALLQGRVVDGDNPNPAILRYLVLISVKNNSGIPINDCVLKGTLGGRDEVYANDVCEPFHLRVDETTHKPVLSFEVKTRSILLPAFSKKAQWSLYGSVFDPPGPHQFVFMALSSSAPVAQLTISASFETGDWKFSEG